jgi:hypothetical protein
MYNCVNRTRIRERYGCRSISIAYSGSTREPTRMQVEFDDGTLLVRNASEEVPYVEWDDRVDEYRAQAYRYRALLDWAGTWDDTPEQEGDTAEQRTRHQGCDHSVADAARAYPNLDLTPALHIEPRDYQQAALDAWIDHGRRGSVVLPTGSGKTFLGLQAIAAAGVSILVVAPTIDLMNQWHATLTNAFGDQLTEPIGVLGDGSHERDTGVPHFDSAWEIDQHAQKLDLSLTVLQPVFFFQNFEAFAEDVVEDGQVALPLEEGVPVQMIDTGDVGRAAAVAFENSDEFVGERVELAGDEMTLAETAETLSEVTGVDVEPIHVPIEYAYDSFGEEFTVMCEWFNEVGYSR